MSILKKTIFSSIKTAFSKTRDTVTSTFNSLMNREQVGEKEIEEIEKVLLQSDFGYEFTDRLISELKKKIKHNNVISVESIKNIIKEIFINSYNQNNRSEIATFDHKIIILFGINGSGKTTTLAKLAHYFSKKSKKVIIGSCDTFRAAANEQLKNWAKIVNINIVEDFSKDPSAVAFETLRIAKENKYDIILIDTAGRLHTNKNLIEELKKILNTLDKNKGNYSIESYLVVDGNSGQNASVQLQEFSKFFKISGLIVTKLDGTAKGGSIINISCSNSIPIKFIGIGEGVEDLDEFDPSVYIESIIE